jgi:hypothetical protein
LCGILLAMASIAGCKKVINSREPARLGVVFNGWFGFDAITGDCSGGLGSTHWNDGPDTAGIVHKPIGVHGEVDAWYCSADPVRVAHQIKTIEDAGISVLLYSWWGWGDRDLDGLFDGHPDQWVNRALEELLKQLKDRKSNLKVAILIEPFTATQAGLRPEALQSHQFFRVASFLYQHFYSRYPEQMLDYHGYPLLTTFDPMFMIDIGMVEPFKTGHIRTKSQLIWWPLVDRLKVEIAASTPDSKLELLVLDRDHLRIHLATGPDGIPFSTAWDLYKLLESSQAARALVRVELGEGSGAGFVKPMPARWLTSTTKLTYETARGHQRIHVANMAGFVSGSHLQLTDAREGKSEVATIAGVDAAKGILILKEPLRLRHHAGALVKKAANRWTLRLVSSQLRSYTSESEGWHWWLVPQQPLARTLSRDGVVFLNHRFSEYYLHLAQASYLTWHWRDIDPFFEERVYESHWQWALDRRDALNIIFVYSWNFYGELAQLEPSTMGPAPPGHEYLLKTKRYYEAFRAGDKRLPRMVGTR